jgi:tetratricopeptide (TPR) repeat protein
MTSTVRVFISSPGDVMPERARVDRVLQRLNAEFAASVRFEPIRWEESYYTATKGFQQQIPRPADCDLVLCILWKRLGSPLPPEQFQRSDGTPYASGTEFEFEDAQSRALAAGSPDILVYRKTETVFFEAGERLALEQAQLQALEGFWTRWFRSESGHFIAGHHSFRSTDELEALAEKHLRAWLARREQVAWPETKGSPFRGLEPFDEGHAAVFFGRRRAIEQLRARLIAADLRGVPFVLLLGSSGTGKSSLARAGLVPRLLQPGAVPNVDVWRRLVVRPPELGADPALGLCTALYEALPELAAGDYREARDLAAMIAKLPEAAMPPVKAALGRVAAAERAAQSFEREVSARLVLVLDQLEEVFALPAAERDRLIALLAVLVRSRMVWAVATMRSDFYALYQTVPELVRLKEEGGQFDVLPPAASEIREIIQGPAQAAGLAFETWPETGEGIDEVLERAAAQPGALPLLQFTLDTLYAQRDKPAKRLTAEAYRALGGIEGAIQHVADETFERLGPEEQAALPDLLWTLVDHAEGEDQQPTLRTAAHATAAHKPAAERLVAALLARRLLVAGRDAEGPTLRLAHQALIVHWPRAQALVEADRELSRVRRRVEADAAEWLRRGEAEDDLLPAGRRLAEAEELLARRGATLGTAIVRFIRTSSDAELRRKREERERELAREREKVETEERARRERLEYEAAAARRLARRTRFAAIGLGVLFLGAAGAAFYAETERRAAQRNYEIGLGAADALVEQVVLPLKDTAAVPVATRRRILESSETVYQRLSEVAGDTPELRYRRARVLNEMAAAYQSLGDLAAAGERAGRAEELLAALVALEPGNATWRHDLAVSWSRIGDVKWYRGDLAGALAAYQRDFELSEALAREEPGNADRQRDLAVAWNNLGDTKEAEGDAAGALAAFQSSLAIAERLTQQRPDNSTWQLDLAASWNRIGDAKRMQRDPAASLEAYEKSLAIAQRLAEREPDNTAWQRGFAVALERVGDARLGRGNFDGALEVYAKELEVSRRLAGLDRGNAVWQRGLLLALDKVGDVKWFQSDFAGALASYQEAREIAERLAEADPSNLGAQRDLASSWSNIGDTRRQQNDLAQAVDAYRKALAIRDRLAQQDPQNAARYRDLAVVWRSLGDLRQAQGDLPAALDAYRAALAADEKVLQLDPNDAQARHNLVTDLGRIGIVSLALGDRPGAEAALTRAKTLAEQVLAAHPDDKQAQADKAWIDVQAAKLNNP